ncbi:hypothetical protein MRB53_026042 [Persea americana]|uniref:Uncharacterized protein n=1 Tax=Persea americana TaxID=3435 RepID=A0ACC2LHK8_PERAE|nr:hypothetical protein MRB53_026042 [Persea americana]
MGLCRKDLFIIYILIIMNVELLHARRPLEREWLLQKDSSLFESLSKGPAPPSEHSSCTYVPRNGGGHCHSKMRKKPGERTNFVSIP